MSFITTNYKENEASDYSAIESGEYEMVINDIKEQATKSGAESLQFDLIIRNDVPQKHQNRHIFNDNWKRKATNQYDMAGFQYILDAVKVPEGTDIPTMEAFRSLLINKVVRVYVKRENNEYNGETTEVNRVAPWNYRTTKFPDNQHRVKLEDATDNTKQKTNVNPFADNGQSIDISDDDLPF